MKLNRFFVRLVDTATGQASYLDHKGRMQWTRATAQRHARDFVARFPQYTATLEGA